MDFHNCTPFPALNFRSRTVDRQDFGVVVLRGSFSLNKQGNLRLSSEQQPLTLTDEYCGAPGRSGLKLESSLAPYKPATDVLVQATAHSPSGRAEGEWLVGVHFGAVSKELRVTGPRQWVRGLTGWSLTAAERVETVAIDYEHAFGGVIHATLQSTPCEINPVGRGNTPSGTAQVSVPQVLPAGHAKLEFGKPIPVAGLGPIAPQWQPRRAYAGTFDGAWQAERWPELPRDFSFKFYNTASAGLTLPGFARGNETVRLSNLTPEHELVFQLPGIDAIGLLILDDRRLIPYPIHLDTIQIDALSQAVYLTWRGIYPLNLPVRKVSLRLDAPACLVDPAS